MAAKKSAETGSRQVPRFGFFRERQSPDWRVASHHSGGWLLQARNVSYAGFRVCLPWCPFKIVLVLFGLCLLVLNLFFLLAREAAAGAAPAYALGTKVMAGWIETKAMADKIAKRRSFLTKVLHHLLRLTGDETQYMPTCCQTH